MKGNHSSYWVERCGKNEKRGNDFRTPYERDYARVVHSSAFRRLQAKTQILGIGDSDFHRTRLTHSMEASQIGEGIAKKLLLDTKENENWDVHLILPDPMLIRAICLAHDFGHPPFGHGGEMALNRCMLPYGGFEGNGQTLRILTCLEPYHEKFGMNLTRRTVLGIIKYPARYSDVVEWRFYPKGAKAFSKAKKQGFTDERAIIQAEKAVKRADRESSLFVASDYIPPKCYLDTEHHIVTDWITRDMSDWKRVTTGRRDKKEKEHWKTKYMSLDTSIMEIADDIAYGIHDLEDAITLGFVDKNLFKGQIQKPLLEPLLLEVYGKQDINAYDHWVCSLFSKETFERKRIIGQLVNYCLQNVGIDNTKGDKFVCSIFRYQAKMKNPANNVLKQLKDFIAENVIKQTAVQQLEFKRQKIVTELFGAFATDPKRLLECGQYEKTTKAGGSVSTERVVCDYIAGMTDEYATKRYQQLFEPRIGSVFDRF